MLHVYATAGPVPAERWLTTTCCHSASCSTSLRHRRPRAGGAVVDHYGVPPRFVLHVSTPPPAPCRRSAWLTTTVRHPASCSTSLRHRRPRAGGAVVDHYGATPLRAPRLYATAGPVPRERWLTTTRCPPRFVLHVYATAGPVPAERWLTTTARHPASCSTSLRHRRPRAGGAVVDHYAAPPRFVLHVSTPPPAPCRRSGG